MVKPYKEGNTWSVRIQRKYLNTYLSGFVTQEQAQAEINRLLAEAGVRISPAEEALARALSSQNSPFEVSLAQALQHYGLERLPLMKGAVQEARRINRYLLTEGLQLLVATPNVVSPRKTGRKTNRYRVPFLVHLADPSERKTPPAGLEDYRAERASETKRSDVSRAKLAKVPVGHVTRYQVQRLMDDLAHDGLAPATVALERALLRRLMNYAHKVWGWSVLSDNPATGLTLRRIDNRRNRVLTEAEQRRLGEAIATCKNPEVGPAIVLLLETAMRTSEPLRQACWGDVDWGRCVLTLRDAKGGGREVPLSERALKALELLRDWQYRWPDAPILTLTYEALKAAWYRICERAGLENLNLHDLRHTAATRLAKRSGNVFLVQALTGHKTLSQVQRYVHVTAEDVVRFQREGHQAFLREEPFCLMGHLEPGEQAASEAPSSGGDSEVR